MNALVEIKFCEHNVEKSSESLPEKLKQSFDHVTISVGPCLGYCGSCSKRFYALLDGELVQAENTDELFEKLKTRISNQM